MATSYRSRNEFDTIDEHRDINREGEAREWANNQLKKGIKVEIGYYSVYHSQCFWHPYLTPDTRGKIMTRSCQVI